jgi:hypothetical protein
MRIAIIVAVVAVGGCTPKPIEQQPERRTIRLVSSTFELQPGAEGYQCQVLTLTEDVFEEQTIGVFAEPIVLDPGDRIDATCTYTEEGVGKTFGDSSNAEMCFAIAFTYPPIASTFCNN